MVSHSLGAENPTRSFAGAANTLNHESFYQLPILLFLKNNFIQASCHRPVLPDTWETGAERLTAQSRPGLQNKFKTNLGNLVRPCLKIKSKKCHEDSA